MIKSQEFNKGEGSKMLDISFSLVAFMIVLFIALIYILNTMMYKPLLDFMHKRDESIANDIANIEGNDSEISELEAKANENISKAKQEASEIKASMISKVKDELSSKFEEKKAALEDELNNFLVALGEKKEVLKGELEANLAQYKEAVEAKIKNVREIMAKDEVTKSEIDDAVNEMFQEVQKFSAKLYEQQQASTEQAQETQNASNEANQQSAEQQAAS